jgi:integrase
MPRTAKLGQKNGHWYSEAGGAPRYYGKVGVVSFAEAMRAFRLALTKSKPGRSKKAAITVEELTEMFLAWLKQHRSQRTHYERSRHLGRFSAKLGRRKAHEIAATDLEVFLEKLAKNGAAADWQAKHEVSVRAMIRWGVRHSHLPDDFRPFAVMEPIKTPIKTLLESDLPTPDQIRSLFASASPYLLDFITVQHATGARTGELRKAEVGQYQPTTRQIVLTDHKRAKTTREKAARIITLNDRAHEVVSRLSSGRDRAEPIFRTPTGKRWSSMLLSHHFRRARKAAGVPDHITPYSFRHLWISEMLMAGVDVLLVARMAGTSIAMIERVYGRFRAQSLADAMAKLDAARR